MISRHTNIRNKNFNLKVNTKKENKEINNIVSDCGNDKNTIIIDNKNYTLDEIKLLIEENNQLK